MNGPITRVGPSGIFSTRDEHGSSATGVGFASGSIHFSTLWIASCSSKLTIGISPIVVSSAHLPVSDATARRISSRFSSHIFCMAFSCCFRHAAAFVLPLANVLRSVERIAG